MAISGGCTASSYTYTMVGDTLTVTPAGARLWSACDTVAEAVAKLRRGESATVAGVDAAAVRAAVTGRDERGREVTG